MAPTIPPRILKEEEQARRRMALMDMFKAGEGQSAIASRLNASRQAVHRWWHRFRRQGAKGLERRPRTGRPLKLGREKVDRLPSLLTRGACSYGFPTDIWTTGRVAHVIQRKWGVRYDADHVSRLMHRCGLSWQKAESRALERDEEYIRGWKSGTWGRLKKKPAN